MRRPKTAWEWLMFLITLSTAFSGMKIACDATSAVSNKSGSAVRGYITHTVNDTFQVTRRQP